MVGVAFVSFLVRSACNRALGTRESSFLGFVVFVVVLNEGTRPCGSFSKRVIRKSQ